MLAKPEIQNIYNITLNPGAENQYQEFQLLALEQLRNFVFNDRFSFPIENLDQLLIDAKVDLYQIFLGHEKIISSSFGVSELIGNLCLLCEAELRLSLMNPADDDFEKYRNLIDSADDLISSWRFPSSSGECNKIEAFFEVLVHIYYDHLKLGFAYDYIHSTTNQYTLGDLEEDEFASSSNQVLTIKTNELLKRIEEPGNFERFLRTRYKWEV